MKLLQQQYIDRRLQKHLEGLQLPQSGSRLAIQDLLVALEAAGDVQPQEAPEEENVWRWPFEDNDGVVFLSHCNLRSFYLWEGGREAKAEAGVATEAGAAEVGPRLCITLGQFATFVCGQEDAAALAQEIVRIDTELIPQWCRDFEELLPDEVTKLATDEFAGQFELIRGCPVILDTLAARIFGVSVTDVRQAISRSKALFGEEAAFHLTFEELSNRYRSCLNPPKFRRSDYLPYAITQQGFCLLSMRLRSPIAIKMNICIIETVSAHIPLRELLKSCTVRD